MKLIVLESGIRTEKRSDEEGPSPRPQPLEKDSSKNVEKTVGHTGDSEVRLCYDLFL